jgi:Xaa-Pro aminopeptidase
MIEIPEYKSRRAQLVQQIKQDAVILITSAPEYVRNGDVQYPYRQNSDFYYLTGFTEPEAVMVLIPNGTSHRFILFNRDNDPDQEIWHGKRAGQQGACKVFGADEAHPIETLAELLPELLKNRSCVYYPIGCDSYFDDIVIDTVNQLRARARTGVKAPSEFHDISPLVHEMRLIKSESETDLMRQAAQMTVLAHQKAMKICKPGLYEYQLEAELLQTFCQHGSRFPAYSSIVGGGENSCILHYVQNDAQLKDGDLVLIDAGAEYFGYAADVTRTFPVNGKFNPEQAAIYQLVLKAQLAAIEAIKPGCSWESLQEIIVKVLTTGLVELEILSGKVINLIEKQAYKPFYMHNSGHWLGLDVHDVGSYKCDDKWRCLEPGMVLTVEPGLYISAGNRAIAKKWWNIGVRIEDDVLVTQTGHEVLTQALPKEVAEIEVWMRQ